mmetsp:Transcript_30682/g.64962  ORF Transcript_30682/g.64962 Transcript_30682/m.64962 type:complete len:317 (+) Transcript_30682:100-1050(+)
MITHIGLAPLPTDNYCKSTPTRMLEQEDPRSTDNKDVCRGTFAEIKTMLKQEEQYICRDYYGLKGTKMTRGAIDMVSCRAKVCQWIFHTADCARFNRETAIVAMSLMDRFLSLSSPRAKKTDHDRREYQLVALTSLYIAVKISEPIGMNPTTISHLSRGHQTEQDIISCEREILSSLRWKVNGPTPFQFTRCILDLLPDSTGPAVAPKLCGDSHRQIEVAVGDYAFVPLRRSSIAVGAIINSLENVAQEDLSVEEKIQFIQLISDAFDLDLNSPKSLVNAVRKRLLDRSAKYGISSRCELSQDQVAYNTKCNGDKE